MTMMTVYERILSSIAWFAQVCVTFNNVLHKEKTTKERSSKGKGGNKDTKQKEKLFVDDFTSVSREFRASEYRLFDTIVKE